MSDEHDLAPKETATAYAAFLEYCAMGRGRSLPKLAQKFGESAEKIRSLQRQYEKWSSRHKWQERVKQYDREQIEARVAKKQALKDEMDERHARQAREEQEIARAHIMASLSVVPGDGESEDEEKGHIAVTGKISLAAVQLLKNSREDERKAIVEEELPALESGGPVVGIMVYLPQKRAVKEVGDGSSE